MDRARLVSDSASGFLYYVSVKGVTGSSKLDVSAVSDKLNQFRALSELPLGVGFGISTPEDAAAVSEVADAVIVGSALIKAMEAETGRATELNEKFYAKVCELIKAMRDAMDREID